MTSKEPDNELEAVVPVEIIPVDEVMPAAVNVLAVVMDLVVSREPEKELEPAPVEKNWADVVTLPVAWRPREVFKLPEKELEPVTVWKIKPLVVRLPVAWIPLATLREPPNELEEVELPMEA